MPHVIKVSDTHPIAKGTQRWVYHHPLQKMRLLKVLRPRALTQGRAALAVWTEKVFPGIRRRWARKEYAEYTRLMLDSPGPVVQPPIAHMYGFAVTDEGLACLTEAVWDKDGLGETLATLVAENRLSDADLALFNDTVSRLYTYNVRAGDLTPPNFVFGHRDYAGQSGPRECVLVDGFGDIHAIPIRSLSAWTNRLGLDDGFKRLAVRTGLRWDPKKRQFSRT